MKESLEPSGSSFLLKKKPSPSIEALPAATQFNNSAKLPITVDYDGDGQAHQNQMMHHFSHPQHPLAEVSSPYLYTCMGCKEYGAGTAFSCQICSDFHLHEFCALASPALNSHPLHPQHQLLFHSKSGTPSSFSLTIYLHIGGLPCCELNFLKKK